MLRSPASELPAEVLERIFSAERPPSLLWPDPHPVLSVQERLRCQLVCKAWRRALDPRRWPLRALELNLDQEAAALALARWLQRVQPGLEELRVNSIETAGDPIHLQPGSPVAQAACGALLALQPRSALRSLSLGAPLPLLSQFMRDLGSFVGVTKLYLRAHPLLHLGQYEAEYRCDRQALLLPARLAQLPPHLHSLTAAGFFVVRLAEQATAGGGERAGGTSAASAAAAGGAAVAQLLPGLTSLRVTEGGSAALDLPLPSLAELSIDSCSTVDLAGQHLWLPQLTSVQLEGDMQAQLRCAAVPALAQLSSECCPGVVDSFASLQHLTRLTLLFRYTPQSIALVGSVPPSLRSLIIRGYLGDEPFASQMAGALAAAGASHLTHLEFDSLACLAHLPAWPQLHTLVLQQMHPGSVTAEQLAALAAAPSLRQLIFVGLNTAECIRAGQPLWQKEARDRVRLEELRQALPGCTVRQGMEWYESIGLLM